MANINNVKGQFEGTASDSKTEEGQGPVKFEFLSNEEMTKLLPMATAWGKLTLREQVKTLNSLSRKMSGDKISPLVVQTREGEFVYPHVTFLSKISSFSPVLALPHSGQGFATIDHLDIRHPAVLSYEITIGECGSLDVEVEEGENPEAKATAAKVAFAKKALQVKWSKNSPKKGTQRYLAGQIVPDGAMMYHIDYGDGRIVAGPRINKAGFDFIVKEPPILRDEDFIIIGKPEKATRVKVQLKIRGEWHSTSEAEKFAAMLTKLCIDKMPQTNTPEDLLKGGILLYEDEDGDLVSLAQKILKGKVAPCPLTDVGSGQETQKGASTAEPCAAWLKALTGKSVLRKEEHHEQTINGTQHPVGWVVWDEDSFVDMRNAWNTASIHSGIWVRWVDDWMKEVLEESTKKKSKDFNFTSCPQGGWYVFHRTKVRTELAPLTMETSTQKENLSPKGKGSIFWELINVLSQMS